MSRRRRRWSVEEKLRAGRRYPWWRSVTGCAPTSCSSGGRWRGRGCLARSRRIHLSCRSASSGMMRRRRCGRRRDHRPVYSTTTVPKLLAWCRPRPQELASRRLRCRWRPRRGDLRSDRSLQAQLRRPVRLPGRCPRAHRRSQDQPHRRAPALELGFNPRRRRRRRTKQTYAEPPGPSENGYAKRKSPGAPRMPRE